MDGLILGFSVGFGPDGITEQPKVAACRPVVGSSRREYVRVQCISADEKRKDGEQTNPAYLKSIDSNRMGIDNNNKIIMNADEWCLAALEMNDHFTK